MYKSAYSLEGKNILITGASSGIGKEIAAICSAYGANIGLIGRNREKLEEAKSELSDGNHHILEVDIKSTEFLEKLAEYLKKFEKIDGFVHSAGAELTKSLSISSVSDFAENYDLNVIKGFMIAKQISNKKYLPATASYVFISSVMSVVGQPGKIVYSASKGGLVAGVRGMALELVPKRVRVNTISPGMVHTPMSEKMLKVLPEESKAEIEKAHPLGIGQPSDIAYAAHFLLSDASKWITGTNFVVDGGYSIK